MPLSLSQFRRFGPTFARYLIVGGVAIALVWGGLIHAANQSVQGAKKEEGGFDGDAPTAILIEA